MITSLMVLFSLFLPILLILLCGSTEARPAPGDPRAELLNAIKVITFHKGHRTVPGRTPSEFQTLCRGYYCGTPHEPSTVVCNNLGVDSRTSDPAWKCIGNQRIGLWLDDFNVICEGFRDRDDPWILKGSCNFEYTLRGVPLSFPSDWYSFFFYFSGILFFVWVFTRIFDDSPNLTRDRILLARRREEERRVRREQEKKEEEEEVRRAPEPAVVQEEQRRTQGPATVVVEVFGGGGPDPSDQPRRRSGPVRNARDKSPYSLRIDSQGYFVRNEPTIINSQEVGGTKRREDPIIWGREKTPDELTQVLHVDSSRVGETKRREEPQVVQPVRASEVVPNLSVRYNQELDQAASDLLIQRILETGETKRREEPPPQEESVGGTKRREEPPPQDTIRVLESVGGTKRREDREPIKVGEGATKRRG